MNIHLAFLIVMCNMLCWQGSKLLVSLFALELGTPQFYIGAIVATYALFPMLLAIYAGKLSDRLGVYIPMICGTTGVISGLLLPYLFPSIPTLFLSAAVVGASHIFYNVAMQNLVGILSTHDTRTRNYTNLTLVISIASTLGPLAAGFSIDHFGHASTYLYFAGVPLISVLILVLSRHRLKPAAVEKRTAKDKSGTSGSLLAIPPLRRILIIGAIVVTGNDLFQFYMPIYGHSVGLSASAIGVVISCFAAAAFAVRVVMPTMVKRWGEQTLMLWSVFLAAGAYLLFPLFTTAGLLAVVAFALGLSMGCSAPLALTLIHAHAPHGRSGEALGMRLTLNSFTHMAVPLLFGALGSALGVAPVFIANSMMLAGGGMLMLRPIKP